MVEKWPSSPFSNTNTLPDTPDTPEKMARWVALSETDWPKYCSVV